MRYGTSDMRIRHNGTVVFCRVLCPKISTGLEKLAPTGWHGWHVFATLQQPIEERVEKVGSEKEWKTVKNSEKE